LPGYIFSMAVENGLVALAGTDGLTLVSAADDSISRILSEATLPGLGLELPSSGILPLSSLEAIMARRNY